MLFSTRAAGEDRLTFVPAIQIGTLHDDNLFFAGQGAAGDLILRVQPSIEMQFASPRLSAVASYEFADDRYRTHSNLSNRVAHQRAAGSLQLQVSPRLAVGLDGNFTDTDTPSELNILTALAAARLRARWFELAPSAHYRFSPRLTAHAAFSSVSDSITDGSSMRSRTLVAGIEERATPRDRFTLDSEISRYAFQRTSLSSRTRSYALRGGWAHAVDARTDLTVSAGPRVTDGAAAAEYSIGLTRRWQHSTATIAAVQTQTTAVGLAETIQVRGVEARFTSAPNRSLTAFATPAVFRSMASGLDATVYRIAVGGRYAVTPQSGFEVSYTRDSQHGALGALRAGGPISRSVLSVGFTARWTASEVR